MGIYEMLSKNELAVQLVRNYKSKKEEKNKRKRIRGKYQFINHGNHRSKLCIILAGYKEFLWDDIFSRIKAYCPDDIDVCIVSSGIYSEKLCSIANDNSWSYLSVKQNKVTLAQNVAIHLFKEAEVIFKLDEDMFITRNFFSQLLLTYEKVSSESNYRIGFVAPMIPLNGFSNVNYLKKTGTIRSFEKKFGKAYHDGGVNEPIIKNPDIATFMWGKTESKLRNIDKISEELASEKFSYDICSIRFSIGAILFTRDTWEDMGRFKLGPGNDMGQDEVQLCNHCMIESRIIVVSENTVVGHFSYGPQTSAMKEYYQKNKEIFCLKDKEKNK